MGFYDTDILRSKCNIFEGDGVRVGGRRSNSVYTEYGVFRRHTDRGCRRSRSGTGLKTVVSS